MAIHVALLRGINVGGKNKVPMKDLAQMFEVAGCTQVQTYIASGNVVFAAKDALAKKIGGAISEAIEAKLGLSIDVVTRSAAELAAAAKANPFFKAGVDTKPLYVGFLHELPSASRLAALDPNRSPPDEYRVVGREIFFRFVNSPARTKLTTAYFDSRLGTTSTVRNWNTLQKLVELCAAAGEV
jgi:uncharacterized protein (DUF1697 family)